MKIPNSSPLHVKLYNQSALSQSKSAEISNVEQAQELVSTSKIPFTGIHNIKPKKLDIDSEVKKLLKQIGEILELDSSNFNPEEYFLKSMRRMLDAYRNLELRKQKILDRLDEITSDFSIPAAKRNEMLLSLRREVIELKKKTLEPVKPAKPKKNIDEDKMDFQLLNRLKSAVLKGDFNLLKVYKNYYSGLADIEDLESLAKAYPKIKIPPRPEEVVAKRVLDTLTRDFYEKFDEFIEAQDPDGCYALTDEIVLKVCKSMTDNFNVDTMSAYEKLAAPIHTAVLRKYSEIKMKDAFSSIPIQRKFKEPKFSQTDIAMLRVNYDEFVLDVLKRQYLGSEKLNEIVYEGYGVKIPVRSLSGTEYKIDKASERIRQFVTSGEKIKAAQRDYDNFGVEELNRRLEQLSAGKCGSNDIILAKIIDFNSCQFEPEDVSTLRQFLRKLDAYEDGEISLDELKDVIIKEHLSPRGTERLNSIERQKLAELKKLEQKKIFELTSKQDEFDTAMDMLYENDMAALASSCMKHRPNSLDPKETARAQYIIDVISDVVNSAMGRPVNKSRIEASITRWDTYNFYLENKADSPLLKDAMQFAKKADGSVDVDRAGQFIINSELVESYPESLSFAKEPEVLKKVMERVSSKEKAIEYLLKFDDYTTLPASDKTKILVLNDIFKANDPIDKFLLKHVIEGDYARSETKILTRLNDKGDEFVESTFHPNAKQQIIDKYKYPLCMDYLQAFEEAFTTIAPTRGASGIKLTGSNNKAIQYKMEVKIKGHDDRLFSSNNDYVFDVFSPRGLH